MKKLLFLLIITSFIGCKEDYCGDEISQYNKKIKYTVGEILTFKDSLSNLKYDTVTIVNIDNPNYDRYLEAKKDGPEEEYRYKGRGCEANSFVKFSNLFYIVVYSNGYVKIQGLLGWMDGPYYGFWDMNVFTHNYIVDTIDYTYNNKNQKALKYSYYDDTLNGPSWQDQYELTKQNDFIYHDYTFIYEDEIKLVEYTTVDRLNKKKRWVLVE